MTFGVEVSEPEAGLEELSDALPAEETVAVVLLLDTEAATDDALVDPGLLVSFPGVEDDADALADREAL